MTMTRDVSIESRPPKTRPVPKAATLLGASPVPNWRRKAEAVATFGSFAVLAFVLLIVWLTLMEANAWI